MSVGFVESALDLTIEKWSDVERFNLSLESLLRRRKSDIEAEGPLFASKTAWKCALLQQSLLYRVTMLACGCADTWNSGNVVCSILAARALLETIALCEYTTEKLLECAEARDVDAVDDLANKELFSTRNDEMVADGVGFKATNVLTFIDKLDRRLSGVRESYDFLSEWCHPNGSGHLATYGDINKQTGAVKILGEKHSRRRYPGTRHGMFHDDLIYRANYGHFRQTDTERCRDGSWCRVLGIRRASVITPDCRGWR